MPPNISELVDIIDSNNRTIGQTTKGEAHSKGLLHRTIISEITNPEGNWLLVKQASDRQDPGRYVSPVGGHIKAGESELTALSREASEETGILDVGHPKRIGAAIFNRHVNGHQENHLFIVYEIKVGKDFEPILNHESESYRWFAAEEIRYLINKNPTMFGDAFHFVWHHFIANDFASPTPSE